MKRSFKLNTAHTNIYLLTYPRFNTQTFSADEYCPLSRLTKAT